MAVSNTLKELRTERHMNQDDLAFAIGSCSRTIGRIERGERNVSIEYALRLARYFEVNVKDIFTLDNE